MMNRLSVIKKYKKNMFLPLVLVFILGSLFWISMDIQVVGATNQDDETETSQQETEINDTEEDKNENTNEIENSDNDDDGIEDEEEEVNEREIKIEANADEVKIESQLKVGEKKNEIQLEIKTTDEPEIKLEFEADYESESESIELELEFKIRFYSLIEYNDLNQDGLFNESQDEIVQEIRLDQIEYLPISYKTEEIDSNTTLHIINATSSNGLFSLQFYLINEFSLINDVLITPTEMKFDIGINNFPYNDDTSMLALKIRLEAENEYEYDEDTEDEDEGRSTNEEEVEITMNGYTGFFSWIERANVDGTDQSVKSSPVDDDDVDPTEQKIYLNYPRGLHILHDPKIGVEGILQAVNQSVTPGFLSPMTLIILAIIGGIFAIYRRKH